MRARTYLAVALVALAFIVAMPVLAQQRCDDADARRSASRFDDHRDGTVTDRSTRLMWMRCAAGQAWQAERCVGTASRHDWLAAQREAEQVNRSGRHFYADWRVPQVRELATLAERRCADPRIDLAQFPDTPAAAFWTATARPGVGPGVESQAIALSFGADGVGVAHKSEAVHVRLVRHAD